MSDIKINEQTYSGVNTILIKTTAGGTINITTNDTPHFRTCYLDDTSHVVINVPVGMTFTNVKAHYIDLGG